MPIQQSILLTCMRSVGYEINEKGLCFGLCTMAEQACLAGELDIFFARIQQIAPH